MTPSLISEFTAREQSAQQKSRGEITKNPWMTKAQGLHPKKSVQDIIKPHEATAVTR